MADHVEKELEPLEPKKSTISKTQDDEHDQSKIEVASDDRPDGHVEHATFSSADTLYYHPIEQLHTNFDWYPGAVDFK